MMSSMEDRRTSADFVVETPNREVLLVVEARNVAAPTPEWALRFLRNLYVHVAIPRSEYFLLALRDHMYLWRRPHPDEQELPAFAGDTAATLAPYLQMIPIRLETMSQPGFEQVVYAWLADLVAGTEPEPEAVKWLEDSGLLTSIRKGTIRAQMAA